jgi:hypothetical protein
MDDFSYNADEQRAAGVPSDAHSQAYELGRVFRLWSIVIQMVKTFRR